MKKNNQHFILGCNFWDSQNGTDMWLYFDEQSLKDDLQALQSIGVRYLRVFPNWRDFQPVISLRGWRGELKEYRWPEDRVPTDRYYIDPVMIERFRKFCEMAKDMGMKLVVSVLTGWMSGRLFYPPALEGKNLICDKEALMLEEKFVRGFVEYTKDIDNIVYWDLGNECNCLGITATRNDAYMWTATVRNAILASDQSRPIMSGMHALEFEPFATWSIADQGELCDMLTPHPYPSPTVGGDIVPANRMRTTLIPTAQCEYYAGISGKPAIIQESGTFSDMLINKEGSADFLRANICSCYANGFFGYLWWCAHEHLHLTRPPYTWSMIERQLGILDSQKQPKPVGEEMKRMGEVLDALPELPPKQRDAVIVLSRGQNQWEIGAMSYILTKQAGISAAMCSFHDQIPEAPLYFLPSITGWAALDKEPYDALLSRVKEGATLYISVASGLLADFENVSGVYSDGMMNAAPGTAEFTCSGGFTLPVSYVKKFLFRPFDAEVLARDQADGTPLFVCHTYGRGKIYLLGFAPEKQLWGTAGAFEENAAPFHKIYAEVARDILRAKPISTDNEHLGVTFHPINDSEAYAVMVNYSHKVQNARMTVCDGYAADALYGTPDAIGKCDMCVLHLHRV